ncbi:hypothetical protein P9209_27510 [Prescottella defluvii]|nr:hypothetical protein P9209_27510 [Prescottella defluvii]
MPYVGYVNNIITGKQRSLLLIAVVGGLLVYAVTMFVSAGRDKARQRRQQPITDDDATTVEIPVIDESSASTTSK